MRRDCGTEPVAGTLLPVQLPMSDLELSRACTERGQGMGVHCRSLSVPSFIQKTLPGEEAIG